MFIFKLPASFGAAGVCVEEGAVVEGTVAVPVAVPVVMVVELGGTMPLGPPAGVVVVGGGVAPVAGGGLVSAGGATVGTPVDSVAGTPGVPVAGGAPLGVGVPIGAEPGALEATGGGRTPVEVEQTVTVTGSVSAIAILANRTSFCRKK